VGVTPAPTRLALVRSIIPSFHNSDLLLRQPIRPIYKRVDLRVGGLDLALVETLDAGRPSCRTGVSQARCRRSTRSLMGWLWG
jgi:hypothetical protein